MQLWLSTVQKLVVARLLLLRFLHGAQLPVVAQQLHKRSLVSKPWPASTTHVQVALGHVILLVPNGL